MSFLLQVFVSNISQIGGPVPTLPGMYMSTLGGIAAQMAINYETATYSYNASGTLVRK